MVKLILIGVGLILLAVAVGVSQFVPHRKAVKPPEARGFQGDMAQEIADLEKEIKTLRSHGGSSQDIADLKGSVKTLKSLESMSKEIADLKDEVKTLRSSMTTMRVDVVKEVSEHTIKAWKDRIDWIAEKGPHTSTTEGWEWFPIYQQYLYGYWDRSVDPPTFRYRSTSSRPK